MSAKKQRCNAAYWTQRKLKRYCKTPAGKGTDHEGEGPCQEHDLMCEAVASYDRRQTVPSAFEGRGEYTMQLEGPLGEKIRALGGDTVYFNPDGRVADMSFEIVAAKSLAIQMIEDYKKGDSAHVIADIESAVTSSAKIVALAKTVGDLVPLQTVAGVFNLMSVILVESLSDKEELAKVQQEFMRVTSVFRPPERVQRVRPVDQLPDGRKRKLYGQLAYGRLE